MLPMSRRRGACALLWAVLQFALPTLGAHAEAQAASAATAADTRSHVEDRSGPGCRPVHPPDCARCQGLSMHAAPLAAPSVDWAAIEHARSPAARHARPVLAARGVLPLSRAPPRLS